MIALAVVLGLALGVGATLAVLRVRARRAADAAAKFAELERQRMAPILASRQKDDERRDMFAAAGAMLSVISRHPGFREIGRARSGRFRVGVQVSQLQPAVQWFEDDNCMSALQTAVLAVRDHEKATEARS